MNNRDIELKCCPFCLSKASIRYARDSYNVHFIECNNDDCRACIEATFDDSLTDLILRWNTRKEQNL